MSYLLDIIACSWVLGEKVILLFVVRLPAVFGLIEEMIGETLETFLNREKFCLEKDYLFFFFLPDSCILWK